MKKQDKNRVSNELYFSGLGEYETGKQKRYGFWEKGGELGNGHLKKICKISHGKLRIEDSP